ncbi:MAG: hypothetical protein IKX10_05090 [Lachnospiraceae bacterium]|nr:hypothetical protein [Lachnospiraceae bacterium]
MEEKKKDRAIVGIRLIFLGLLFQLFDFVLVDEAASFDIIPDLFGWILIVIALYLTSGYRSGRPMLLPVAVIMLLGEILIDIQGLRGELGYSDMFVPQAILGWFSILFDWMLFGYMKSIADAHQKPERSKSIGKAKIYYLTVRCIGYVICLFGGEDASEALLVILLIASAIGVIGLLYQLLALSRTIRKNLTPGRGGRMADLSLSILLCFIFVIGMKHTTEGFGPDVSEDRMQSINAGIDLLPSGIEWKDRVVVEVKNDAGEKLGALVFDIGLERIANEDLYRVVYRAFMEPNSKMIQTKSGKDAYGYSEYLSVQMQVPDLWSYSPKNYPSSVSSTFSGRVNMRKMPSVALFVDSGHKDIDTWFTGFSPDNEYRVEYDYEPRVWNPFGDNRMVAGTTEQTGYVCFRSSEDEVTIPVELVVRFGTAGNSERSPWSIKRGEIFEKTYTQTFTFKLKGAE